MNKYKILNRSNYEPKSEGIITIEEIGSNYLKPIKLTNDVIEFLFENFIFKPKYITEGILRGQLIDVEVEKKQIKEEFKNKILKTL